MAFDIALSVKKAALNQAFNFLEKDPEKNIPKMLNLVEKLDIGKGVADQMGHIKKLLSDPENAWYKYVMSLWTDLDAGVRKALFENFVVNANMIGNPRRKEFRERLTTLADIMKRKISK